MPPRYTEAEARSAIAASLSYAEALRRMGRCEKGRAGGVLKKWAARWEIPTDHFDPYARSTAAFRDRSRPIEFYLIGGSRISSSTLKEKLYRAGLKERRCELCGQGENWRGRHMSLILDHINGVRDDNRLQNLRVVCPNCNATLETHCGRNARAPERSCERCGGYFAPNFSAQRFCSQACGVRHTRLGRPNLAARRVVERPPYQQLLAEVAELGWVGVGRKYGVSDNAVRKWVRAYERGLGDREEAA